MRRKKSEGEPKGKTWSAKPAKKRKRTFVKGSPQAADHSAQVRRAKQRASYGKNANPHVEAARLKKLIDEDNNAIQHGKPPKHWINGEYNLPGDE